MDGQSTIQDGDRATYVRGMFGRIARRYDMLNRMMTLGQDRSWRRQAVRQLNLAPKGRLLDIGAGTGDLSFEALRQQPSTEVVAADFTPEMLAIGIRRSESDQPSWLIADCLNLPFPEASFDGVISGFLLRNVADLKQALREQHRVLKPGGSWVCLETSPPPAGRLRPLLSLYLNRFIPALGRWIAGNPEAYRYLPNTIEAFLPPEALADALRQTGLRQVAFSRHMFGTVAIHWGKRPDAPVID